MLSLISAANEVWPQWLIFGIYMAVILAVALVTRRKSTSVEGFMFANKGVGGWLSAFAYGATYFSAVVFVGYAGKFGWNFGLSAVWIGVGNMLLGTLAAWLVLANRTKYMTSALGARTMPEFFEKRYESKYIKLFAALIIFIFLLPYSASVYQGMGYIFEAALGIDSVWCILILAGLTAAYLFLGGYFATTITDFIQGTIMIVGIVVTVFMLLGTPEMNWGEGLGALFADPDLTLVPNPVTPEGGTFLDNQLFNIVILVLLTSFGMWGMPQSIHKFYAIKDKAAIRRGAVISTFFSLVVGCGAYFMGSMITRFVSEVPDGNYDRLIPTMIVENLPSALLGLILVLLFSASMSTLAALSLSSSSTVTVDFYKGYIKRTAPESNLNILIRVLCLVFVAASAVLAIVEVLGHHRGLLCRALFLRALQQEGEQGGGLRLHRHLAGVDVLAHHRAGLLHAARRRRRPHFRRSVQGGHRSVPLHRRREHGGEHDRHSRGQPHLRKEVRRERGTHRRHLPAQAPHARGVHPPSVTSAAEMRPACAHRTCSERRRENVQHKDAKKRSADGVRAPRHKGGDYFLICGKGEFIFPRG